ncbi:MAG: hypothetical protein NTV68_04390, partial [Methanomicrobiales archaeon]|nr:hypothetical protein [Methanomicrobiales archaeon]
TSCKHAVAVVLEYLECLKNNVPVRTLADNDPRLLVLARFMPGNGMDLPLANTSHPKTQSELSGNGVTGDDLSAEEKLHAYFDGLTKADLVKILDDICQETPEIGQDILTRIVLVSAAPEALLKSLVTDIAMLAREPGMEVYGEWRSAATDYHSMNDRMEVLLTSGFADDVLKCGRDLFQSANAEIEWMDENGEDIEYGEGGEEIDGSEEIVEEVSECIKTVFTALERSTLPVHERMMYVADLGFNDIYGLCPEDHAFWNGPFTEDDWSRFADLLIIRLAADEDADDLDSEENFMVYPREDVNGKLLFAFESANRSEDAVRFCIGAAAKPGYSPSLVRYLIRLKRWEEARQWIGREIRQEHGHSGNEEELRTLLIELWEQEDDWLHIAGMRAEMFLCNPSIYSYPKLKLASERAGAWREVSEGISDFLTRHKTPVSCVSQSGEGERVLGILPRSGVIRLKPERRTPAPAYELLIAIAIEENDPDEVLVWYDLYMTEKPACPLPPVFVGEIAGTIAEKFPERAVALLKQIAEVYLKEARPKSYELAIRQIRTIRDTLKRQDQLPEWELYLGELKKDHKRKKLFIDMLAVLDERPIVQR